MHIWVVLTLTISCSSRIVRCGNSCAKSSTNIENIKVLYHETVDLVCNTTRNCSRLSWKRDGKKLKLEDISETCTNCHHRVYSTNAVNGSYILRIYNITKISEGIYSCHCTSRIENSSLFYSSTRGCYNLTVSKLHCEMTTSIKGKDVETYNGNHLNNTVEFFYANINDVLSVTCTNGGTKKTNCSELEHPVYEIPLRPSDTWCRFSCTNEESEATCEVIIILNVTKGLVSPNTTLVHEYSTGTTSPLDYTTSFSPNDYQSMPPSKEAFTPSTVSPESEHTNIQLKTTLQHHSTDVLLTTSEKHRTEDKERNGVLGKSIFQDRNFGIFVIAMILMSSVMILQWVYIIVIKKKCFGMCSQKEKWINPIYNSWLNDRATPYAETEISAIRQCSITRHDQSLPCLSALSSQQRRQFHSVDSLNITENKGNSLFSRKYEDSEFEKNQVDHLPNHLNDNVLKTISNGFKLNAFVSDVEINSFFPEDSHTNNRLAQRKERFTSLHIYEDANIGQTT